MEKDMHMLRDGVITQVLTGLFDVSNIESVNIADSKKAALELAEFWNDCYKKNGTLFDFSENWREW